MLDGLMCKCFKEVSITNELQPLSTDLTTITTEIKSYQNIAGQSIFEIGRRLNWVKEHDLAHGEFRDWLKEVNINYRQANRFMKISSELSNVTTSSHLGANVLYEIATLPEEDRTKSFTTKSGEEKKPDEMTVRELRDLKRQLKEQQEANEDLQSENDEMRRTQVELNNQLHEANAKQPEPRVIEKIVTKEVKPDDYDQLKERLAQLEEQSKKDKDDIDYYQRELQASENRRKQSESDDHMKELELKRKKRDAQIDAYSVSLKITDFLPELQKITQDDIRRMGEEAQHNLRTRIDMVRQTIDNIDAMFDGPRVIEGEITNEN